MNVSQKYVRGMVVKLTIVVFALGCWTVNLVKLVNCDFATSGSWKGEIVHGIGLIGPAAIVTVWFDDI